MLQSNYRGSDGYGARGSAEAAPWLRAGGAHSAIFARFAEFLDGVIGR